MIWPWSEIAKWKRLAEHYQAVHEQRMRHCQFLETEYLKMAAAIRGSHKGIWRLKQKLKKYEKEHP